MGKKNGSWEQELWDYVSHGDGDICPVFQRCEFRKSHFKCSCHLYSHLSSIEQTSPSDQPCSCADTYHGCMQIPDDVPCKNSNLSFIEELRPGRISELIHNLAALWLRKGRVRTVPVPSDLINLMDENNQVEIRKIPMKAYSGAIWKVQDSWIIYLNSNESPQHQRVTLFHEAFHLLAHQNGIPVFKKTNDLRGSFNELLGDDFSLQILMPKELVLKEWDRHHSSEILAEKFDVPPDAVDARIEALNLR